MFREAIVGFITAALSIIVALAWRDYITFIFDSYIKGNIEVESAALSGLIYVVLITAIGLLITSIITKYQQQVEESKEQEQSELEEKYNENVERIRRMDAMMDKQVTDDEPIKFKSKPSNASVTYDMKDNEVLKRALDDDKAELYNADLKKECKRKLAERVIPKGVGMMDRRYD